ncbi:OprO/OprP family phosphate-selective porin [Dyella sp. 20L07]|uniref:OprO/OprP family phosphate-selective porin n=1 Tax=Dyella sp. 20L07 TaxID=3384240 RepID=UPI003D26B882
MTVTHPVPARLAAGLAACIALAGCVTRQPRPDAPAVAPEETSAPVSQDSPALDALRRLSLMRPLGSGIDTPLMHTQIHGYVMVDAASYSSKGLGQTDFSVRRADINFQHPLWRDWLLYADGELVNRRLEFKDVYLRKQTHLLGVVTIGNQQEPFGLEQYGSFRNTTFLERATTSAIAPSRSIGMTSSDFHGPWIWSYGFFTAGTRDEGRKQRGLALTGRLAYVLRGESGPYHLAIDYSARDITAGNTQRFDSAPEVALTSSSYFLDTGDISGASRLQRYGMEAAHVSGPFSWQAELMSAYLQRNDGLPSLHFRSWYAYASWMLTGESRDYRESNATFGAVVPHASWNGRNGGALEFAARISQTNLNDRDVFGGKETNLTLGINWYLDKSVRLSANLVHAIDLDKPGNAYDGKHPSALVGRVQYQF